MAPNRRIVHGTQSSTLADVLERVLDKGIVIAGDIKVKLVDIELLTIQIRLVVCSVDKAMEMGMDWWVTDPNLSSLATKKNTSQLQNESSTVALLQERITHLEGTIAELQEIRPVKQTRM